MIDLKLRITPKMIERIEKFSDWNSTEQDKLDHEQSILTLIEIGLRWFESENRPNLDLGKD